MPSRRIFLFAALAISMVAIALTIATCTTRPDEDEVTEPPSPFVLRVPDKFHFLQNDPEWAASEMGASGGTLADFGCTLTSVAMAAANLGLETDPGALNAALSSVDGYTERGWLKWAALEHATNGMLKATVYGEPEGDQIDRCLSEGQYPVVKFMLDDRVQHWALVLGKTKEDWIVRDPLDDTRTLRPLGELTSAFESVRCIRLGDRDS